MKKRFLSIVLSLCMVLTLMTPAVWAADTPTTTAAEYAATNPAAASGTDYEINDTDKTLTINTAKGAAWWSANSAKGISDENGKKCLTYTVKLANDIDVSAFLWTPVGTSDASPFTGNFDGQGHTITGMTVDVKMSSGTAYAGLFGIISGTSGTPVSIQNVGLIDSSVTATSPDEAWAGGIAARADSCTITNCYNTGSINAVNKEGHNIAVASGIVVLTNNSTVTNCYNTGNITGNSNQGSQVGGIICQAFGSTVTNCYNTGNLSATGTTNYIGGISDISIDGPVTNCYYLSTAAEKGICNISDSSVTSCGTFDSSGTLAAGIADQFGGLDQTLGNGSNLLAALNGWVQAQTTPADYQTWTVKTGVNGGYPVFGTASAPHAHCVCGGTTNIGDHTDHSDINYTAIPSSFTGGNLAGNIFLDRDVMLTSSLDVAKGQTLNLCLNGYKLDANGGSFSVIKNSGTLKICDCNKHRQNHISSYAWDEATNAWKTPETITISGGVITGGNTPAGGSEVGGGGICNLGTLHMYGGSIAGNRAATYGGGVHNLGSMILYGGNIQNNGARSVNGLFNYGTGGGVYTKKLTVSIPSLILYGGTITKNLAGNNGAGVFAGEGASVSLAGNTEIYDNINQSYSANLYVDRNTKLKIMGILQNTHKIGINMWTPGVFTENGGGFEGKVSDQIAKFISDSNDYRIVAESNQLGFLEVEVYEITKGQTANGSFSISPERAAAGDIVTITPNASSGYVVDTVTVKQTESPNAAVAVSGNTFTMPAYAVTVTVTFKSTGGASSGGSGGGGSSTSASPAAPVIVSGKTENIGKSETTTKETKVTVDSNKLTEKISSAEKGGNVLVPISDSKAVATAEIVVKNVEDMAKKDMTLEVKSGNVSYELPTTAMDTEAVMKVLGASDASKVPVTVTISKLGESAVTIVNGKLIAPPVEFTVTATYGGKTLEIKDFSQYVQRSIEISKEQAEQITTAVVKNEDGTLRHVPTYVYQKDGKWFAKINSRTNSTYALIRNETAFADAQGKWYENIVSEMASRKIINGKNEISFDGEASITRAEFAAILVRGLGLPTDGTCRFTDVKAGDWYFGAVGTAVEYGFVKGYADGSFAPNANITRQEAMVMIQRAAKVAEFTGTTGSLASFSDSQKVSTWAKSAAEFNVGSGLILGSNGELRSGNHISRAETATVILRLLQKAELVDVRSKT